MYLTHKFSTRKYIKYVEGMVVDDEIGVWAFEQYVKLIERNSHLIGKTKPDDGMYYESHHILPKCYQRNSSAPIVSEKANIVQLSPEDHFMAHYWLYLAVQDRSMARAFRIMSGLTRYASHIDIHERSQLYDEIQKIKMTPNFGAHEENWLLAPEIKTLYDNGASIAEIKDRLTLHPQIGRCVLYNIVVNNFNPFKNENYIKWSSDKRCAANFNPEKYILYKITEQQILSIRRAVYFNEPIPEYGLSDVDLNDIIAYRTFKFVVDDFRIDKRLVTWPKVVTRVRQLSKKYEFSERFILDVWVPPRTLDVDVGVDWKPLTKRIKTRKLRNKSVIKIEPKSKTKHVVRTNNKRALGPRYQLTSCPHCGQAGRGNNMLKFHFDNCNLKK